MALQELLRLISRPAAADLSAHIYKFVEVDSSGNVNLSNALGEQIVGVLQNKPSALGQAAEVAVSGSVTKVIAGGTVASNAKVTGSAAGLAVTAASTQQVHGICLDGGVSGDLITVLLDSQGVLA